MKKPIPFGKYYLLERINVGGMAEVFRAKAYGVEGFERLLAVKRILPNIAEDQEFITMFIDEAKIAVQLNHANIAQIFDLGVYDGVYFIAMEHVFGRDLRAIFERCRTAGDPMAVAQACFVVMKMCEALDYAHNKRDASGREMHLVHRDVSPQNVLVSFEGEIKLCDFGIAKAAGKVGKTQAGILKGKFGYMSPEQVRGLPIDRRSDIFSTGIVLYELLTNERLFTGESDFSTLEKVRNAEILPPSTYNRKIPEELERIVLKALAKDVDDRYQNAIDLHDELQAFVYTAGEFYSRKDVAAYMKRAFAREIEEGTAKLEEFRQLPPPPELSPVAADRPQTAHVSPRSRNKPATVPPPIPEAAKAERKAAPAPGDPNKPDLAWDDDELETQIYDDAPPAAAAGAEAAASGLALAPPPREPTMAMAPVRTPTEDAGVLASGSPPGATTSGDPEPSGSIDVPITVSQAAPVPAPAAPSSRVSAPAATVAPARSGPLRREVADEPQNRFAVVAAALAGVLIVAAVTGAILYFRGDGASPTVVASGEQVTPEDERAPAADIHPETGFDITTDPGGARVTLNGKTYEKPSPLRFRKLPEGSHHLLVEGPAGFGSEERTIDLERGKPVAIHIDLAAREIATSFNSEPPGADVALVVDGERRPIGTTPTQATLDPRKQYRAVFEKTGYVAAARPLSFATTQDDALTVAVVLERASQPQPGRATPEPRSDTPRSIAEAMGRPERPRPPVAQPPQATPPPRPDPPRAVTGTGTLSIGAKPSCRIYIDGKDTGLFTPQRDLELKAGQRRIMLVNPEYDIRKRFTVTIAPGASEKVIKDYTSLMP